MLTDFLKLFKADPADGNNTFNITTMLNENWDKLNAWAKRINATTLLSTTTGTAPNYLVTIPNLILAEGTRVTVKFHIATSSVATLKINNEVAYGIKKHDGADFKNIKSGIYSLVFDGVNFILQGEGGEYGTATVAEVLSGFSIGTENGLANGNLSLTGNAVAAQVLSTKTFYSTDAKTKVAGTMPNRLTDNADGFGVPNIGWALGYDSTSYATRIYVVPKNGWYDGNNAYTTISDPNFLDSNIAAGKSIFGRNGTFTADATATASKILTGYSGYVNGAKVLGSIPVRTNTDTGGSYPESGNVSIYDGQLYMMPPAGYYDGTVWIHRALANLKGSNIKKDIQIGDGTGNSIVGTCKELQQANGNLASFTFSVPTSIGTYYTTSFNITGLSFNPRQILAGVRGYLGTGYAGGMLAYGDYFNQSVYDSSDYLLVVSFDSVVFGAGSVSGRIKVVVGSTIGGYFKGSINVALA